MIVCKECGQSNRDVDSFCGSCGSFLEWTGERSAPAPAAVAVVEAEAPGRVGLIKRVAAAIVGPPTDINGRPVPEAPPATAGGPGAAPGGAPAADPFADLAGPPPSPFDDMGGPPPSPFDDMGGPPPSPFDDLDGPPPSPLDDLGAPPADVTPRAAPTGHGLVAPVELDTAPDLDLAGVLPQDAPVASTPKHRAPPTRKIKPGDKVCGECGEGNPATRKFCSRCGESLVAAEVIRPPWWRKVLPRRGPRLVAAAKRPKSAKGGHRKAGKAAASAVRRYLFVVVLGFGLLTGLYPPLRTYVVNQVTHAKNWATGLVSEKTVSPVHPTSIADTDTQLADHPAKLAFDGFGNTYWSAPWVPNGKPPQVSIDLGKATALSKVVITSGASDDYVGHNRPSIIVFTYSNEKSDTVTLQDSKQPQTFSLRNGFAAKQVRVQILQVNEAPGSSDVALTEVQFFGVG